MWEDGTILGVFKPKGPSSNGIVGRIKRLSGISRVGHAGTLDPLASGVLVVGVGRSATKLLWGKDLEEKEYVADIFFGASSTTGDQQGEKREWNVAEIPSREKIEKTIQKFIGVTEQIPPAFSAIKIAGTPAYKRARQGEVLELKPRTITIHSIQLLAYAWPHAKINVVCKSGVYIRSLIQDVGASLGCGAYMSDLVRTRVGKFTLENSVVLETL